MKVTKLVSKLFSQKAGSVDSSGDWFLEEEELASKFSSKTKAIIVNTPNNPLGKIFSRKELESIAKLCKQHDVMCIMDEVYEWLIYEPHEHVRMGMISFL